MVILFSVQNRTAEMSFATFSSFQFTLAKNNYSISKQKRGMRISFGWGDDLGKTHCSTLNSKKKNRKHCGPATEARNAYIVVHISLHIRAYKEPSFAMATSRHGTFWLTCLFYRISWLSRHLTCLVTSLRRIHSHLYCTETKRIINTSKYKSKELIIQTFPDWKRTTYTAQCKGVNWLPSNTLEWSP